MYFIGLDVGTTGCKAVLFDENGNSYGKSYEEFDIICEQPVWAEQSPAVCINSVKKVLKEAVAQAAVNGVQKEEIAALSTSVLGEEIMPVDKSYRPLRNAILGMDYRASEETRELCKLIPAQEIYDQTGFVPHPMASLPTIMWMRKHEPHLLENTYRYVTFTEYIFQQLSGEEPAIDYPQAGRTMAFDISEKRWSQKLLKAAGMEESMFCRAVETGTVVGTVSDEMAAELGLPSGVKLVAGGQDQTCAALGAGLIDETIGMDSHGTIEGIGVMSNRKITDKTAFDGGISCYTYTIPNTNFLMASSQVGGLLLKWFKNEFALAEILEAEKTNRNVYDVMTSHVKNEPSKVMVLPHFIGSGPPWNDLLSRGAIVGLTIDSTRHDVVKAIMDSLTYEFKINVEYMEQMGFSLKEMRVVGGASKSDFWMQLKANILDREVATLKEKDAACLGAAMIAMRGCGVYRDLYEAANACVKLDRKFEPERERVAGYREAYEKYTHLYGALKGFYHL